MGNLYIIIQARMTSTRLPKKVMLPLCGKTVLEVVIERLKKYKNNIIIATTDDGTEKPIVELCKKLDVKFFQGSTDNVLERYYLSAKKYNLKDNDTIVRITSDCPLIDQSLMEKVIDMFKNAKYDYVSNCRLNRTIPVGLDVEVFDFNLLKIMHENATLDYEKEHVTPYVYITKKNEFRLGNCDEIDDYSNWRLTLDEEEDYILLKKIYDYFKNEKFSYEELKEYLDKSPDLYSININVKQKSVI